MVLCIFWAFGTFGLAKWVFGLDVELAVFTL